MGNKASKTNPEYNIPVNQKLTTDISRSININPSPNEISRFKHIMNKKMNREFTPSDFSHKFQHNKKAIKHISSILSIIYSKNTNNHLKKTNRSLYESVFNYNIIEKDCKGYEDFNKNVISQMGLFINGEPTKNNNPANFNITTSYLQQLPTSKTIKTVQTDYDNKSIGQDSFLEKNSMINLKKSNTGNNDTDNDNIIRAIQEMKEKQGNNNEDDEDFNRKNSNYNQNRNDNLSSPFPQNDNETIHLTEDSFKDDKRRNANIDQLNNHSNSNNNYNKQSLQHSMQQQQLHNNNLHQNQQEQQSANESINLHLEGNDCNNNAIQGRNTNAKSLLGKEGNKSYKKNPKKPPLVNIKINLKDLIKQDVYENSKLPPKERFRGADRSRSKSRSRSRTQSPNTPPRQDNTSNNMDTRDMNGSINNLTTIKASDISQININDGSFLELVDALAQPNKREKLRIHSRTPKKNNKTYESENHNAKMKNMQYTQMFNVTNKSIAEKR